MAAAACRGGSLALEPHVRTDSRSPRFAVDLPFSVVCLSIALGLGSGCPGAGLACLVNVYYAPPRASIYLIAFCLCALLLVVRVHVHRRETTWRRSEVAYNLDVDLAFLRDGLLVSAVALVLAWSVPAAARSPRLMSFWENFQEPGQRLRTVWNRMFTSLNYQGPSALVDFGRTMTLGGAVNLSGVAILEVQADEPHYWRAVYYDLYTGSGWSNTDPVSLVVAPGSTQLRPAVYAAQEELTTTVRMLLPGESVLFTPGQPLRSSVGARVALAYVPGASATLTEVSMMTTLATLRRNQPHVLTSLVSRASSSELRAAGEDYPAWVTDRYLQLPTRLPQRVRSLAREITDGIDSPYEQAEAIQSYLRRIPYDQSISAPPAGVDVVDWFVFVNRRGYCDYYATAMAVLCRAVGIPARVAQGYTAGEYLPDARAYRVYQLDAHAWPELYFPRYGWLPFEPTSSEPAIVRPDAEGASTVAPVLLPGTSERTLDEAKYGPDEALGPDAEASDVVVARTRTWYSTAFRFVWMLASLLAASSFLAIVVWQLSLRGFDQIGRVWEQVRRMGGLIGVPQPLYLTPSEYGDALNARVAEGAEDVRGIVRLYTQHRFGNTGWTAEKQVEMQERWSRLRPLLLRRIMRPKWQRRRQTVDTWVPASSLRPPSMLT